MENTMLKKLTLIVVLAGLSWAVPAVAQDTVGNRMVAAEKYADTVDFNKMFEGMIVEMARNIPSNKRKSFVREMRQSMNAQRVRNIAINSMVQVFTVDELNLLAQFYGSPTGKSIMKKFPEYTGVLMPMLNAEIARAAKK
jgi:hypothetical protein